MTNHNNHCMWPFSNICPKKRNIILNAELSLFIRTVVDSQEGKQQIVHFDYCFFPDRLAAYNV